MEQILEKSRIVQDREKQFTELYKALFPAVAKYISRKGGSLEEAKDVFHDGLILHYEKQQHPETIFQEKAYLMGICKHLWAKRFQEKIRHTILEGKIEDQEAIVETNVSSERIVTFLERAGQKCLDLLQAFYYEKISLEEVSTRFGFSGIRSATVQKYKCLEKVRDQVKTKFLQYEDFLD